MLDSLLAAPVLVKALASLALILVLFRLCGHLAAAVVAGGLLLGLWSGHGLGPSLAIAWQGASSLDTLMLMIVVFEVIWLSSQMAATGVMNDLVDSVRARVRQRAAIAALPAVIGLLPMPGGALFSAPLVDSCDTDGTLSPTLKTQTNYWFRHIWEYWWPLYPGVLLAMEVMKLEVWQFMLIGLPLSLAAISGGYFFLLRRIPSHRDQPDAQRPEPPERPFLALISPILVVIGSYALIRLGHAGLRLTVPSVPAMHHYLPMALGLLLALGVLQWERPLGRAEWKGILMSRRTLSMVVIVMAVRIYGAFVKADLPDGTPLVGLMRTEMAEWGIPQMAVMMLLPLVSGLATGLAVGFVGASFPIVLGMLGPEPSVATVAATTVLAYGFGHVGMMLSPVHVCNIVTNQHFQTRLLHSTAGLIRPAACVLAMAIALHFGIGWAAG